MTLYNINVYDFLCFVKHQEIQLWALVHPKKFIQLSFAHPHFVSKLNEMLFWTTLTFIVWTKTRDILQKSSKRRFETTNLTKMMAVLFLLFVPEVPIVERTPIYHTALVRYSIFTPI